MDPLDLVEPIVVGEHTFETSIKEDLYINTQDLNEEFIEQPMLFAKWATLYELALHREATIKGELDRMYAKVDYTVRQEASNAAIKMTEKKVENSVITHPKYLELLKEYEEIKLKTGLIKAVKDAIVHKRDMLIQLGSTARAEYRSDISIKQDAYNQIKE